jgi:hypothetical protein
MTTIIVLFNLRPDADLIAYENWARTIDIPNVRRLKGVSGFSVLKTNGLLSGSPDAPYQFVELIEISDMTAFKSAVGTPEMQEIAGQFREYAEDPIFMLSESIE